jgi:WD40 repeat protein
MANGAEKYVLKGHSDKVKTVSFSANGRFLASGGFDTKVKRLLT